MEQAVAYLNLKAMAIVYKTIMLAGLVKVIVTSAQYCVSETNSSVNQAGKCVSKIT